MHLTIGRAMQVREGVRTEAEALALGRQVVACRALHLRGLMTHHGNLTAFQPIIQAFKDNFGQVGASQYAAHVPSVLLLPANVSCKEVQAFMQRTGCHCCEPSSTERQACIVPPVVSFTGVFCYAASTARAGCSILAGDVQGIIAHMASSTDGFFDGQQYHLDLVRLGTAMYGSQSNTTAARWLTRITGIKQVRCSN